MTGVSVSREGDGKTHISVAGSAYCLCHLQAHTLDWHVNADWLGDNAVNWHLLTVTKVDVTHLGGRDRVRVRVRVRGGGHTC